VAKERELTKEEVEIKRIMIPKEGEVLGVIEQMLGGDRVKVKCADGSTRTCRIPGRLRKRVWLNVGDLVLIDPWIVQSNIRGDVVFRYTTTQANWMKRKGYVKHILVE
jgi:translation initiation factor 1A